MQIAVKHLKIKKDKYYYINTEKPRRRKIKTNTERETSWYLDKKQDNMVKERQKLKKEKSDFERK